MKYENPKIINVNGQKYRVGWDEHGWFSIEEVELYPHRPEFHDDGQMRTENGLMDVVVQSDSPISFSPEAAGELIEVIGDGL